MATVFSGAATLPLTESLARTSGNYVSIDLHKALVGNSRMTNGADSDYHDEDSNTGLGVAYKYAVNLGDYTDLKYSNRLFVAPGIFFERIGTSASAGPTLPSGDSQRFNMQNRYGVKMDLGYDLNEYISPYLTGGLSYSGYSSSDPNATNSTPAIAQIFRGSKPGWFYGIGLTTKLCNNFSLAFEYNTQSLTVKNLRYYNGVSNEKTRARIDLYKVALIYNF